MHTLILPFALVVINVFVLDLLLWLNISVLQNNRSKEIIMGGDSKIVNPDCTPMPYSKTGYSSFQEFYPYYLGEHHNRICRRLHIIGTTNTVAILFFALITGYYPLALLAIPQAYAFAWVGHFVFEKNKPATFSHPIYSFTGDVKMWWEVMTGQRNF